MHRTKLVFGLTALFLTAGIVVVAAEQGHGSAPKAKHQTSAVAPKAPSVKSVPKAPTPVTTHAKVSQPKAAQIKTTKAAPAVMPAQTTKPVKPATSKSASTVKAAATKPAKAEKPAVTKVAKVEKPEAPKAPNTEKAKASKPAATTTAVAGTTPLTTTLTPVQQKLTKNTNLAAKLTSRLPAGTDLMAASAGFRNLGQFVAAVNVSNNLGLSFTQLKAKMVTDNLSLGQAIQAVRPLTASATIEAQRAEYDARGMIAESELTPQAPAPTPTLTSSKKAKAKTPTR
jgi:hypothetical protein